VIGRAALLAVFVGICQAAEPLTWSSLVGGYTEDLSLNAARRKVAELGTSHGPQLWDDLELRYGAKRADLRKQELALRLSPAGYGELRANRELALARRDLGESVLRLKTAEALRSRYRLALDWLYQNRQRRYHLEMAEIQGKRTATLAQFVSDDRFDPDDLVKAQVKRTEYLSKAEGDLYKIAQIEIHMRQFVPSMGAVVLDGELLAPAEIEAIIARVDPSGADSFPEVQVADRELAIVGSKTSQEIAASRRWIAYLEAGYTFDVDQNSKERATHRDNIAFGAGIKIPVFDGSSQAISRRRADLAEARLDYQDEREDVERTVGELRLSVGSMLRQVMVLDSFAAKVDAGGLFADFARKSGGDPLLVLRAAETSLESRWMIEDLRFLMLYDYLEILHLTGVLVRRPWENHLLAGNPRIVPPPVSAPPSR
jgi:hypothetical protein